MQTRVQKAVEAITLDQKNLATHIEGLEPSEQRRVLMCVANEASEQGLQHVMEKALTLLGFRDEEVLIFATACIRCRPQMVEGIVKRFCSDTAIAKHELDQAARALIHWAQGNRDAPNKLIEACWCVQLMREEIRHGSVLHNNDATNLTLFILAENEKARVEDERNGSMCDLVTRVLRELVPNDKDWENLLKNKERMGGLK